MPAIQLQAHLDVKNSLAQIGQKDLPFAIEVQAKSRIEEKKFFILRNTYTQAQTKIKPATKANLTAEVSAPGYLSIHQEGGLKTPAKARMIAIPLDVRMNPRQLIPQQLRPGQGLSSGAFFILRNLPGGGEAIAMRSGGRIRLAYWLTPQAKVRKAFSIEEIATDEVQKFGTYMAASISQILSKN